MSWQKKTGLFMGAMLIAVIVYDVYAISGGGTEASISQWIFVASYKYPAMTFAFGFLCGHLFWRIRDTKASKKISDSTREF